ncbi:MAG: hypothetical protein COA62_01975 [Rhodobiaceae bacterium]|nr:MAG: hypothetical protein COA62_01975 [Rhodobiaceae bacterium]
MSLSALKTTDLSTQPVAVPDEITTRAPLGLFSIYNDFSSVERVWRRFEETADCFAFQSFDFLETWYRHIGIHANTDVQIVVVWETGTKPLMILPLGIETNGSLRRLLWLGNDINDYNAPMLADNFDETVAPGAFAALWNNVLAALPAHDLVELMRQPAFVGGQSNPFMELDVSLNASGAHMTSFNADFDTYYDEKLNSKAKRHARSRLKKMNAIGETQYIHPESSEDIAASVERLVELKAASLEAMGAHNFLAEAGYADFYKEMAINSGTKGLAHVSHLEIGGEFAAGNWGLVHKGRFYYLLASYDAPRFGSLGPGKQALVETMRWASEQGVEVFDFTIGDERYKSEWCETQMDLHDHLQAKTLRGSATLIISRVLLSAKRKIKQTPALWELFTTLRTKFLAK